MKATIISLAISLALAIVLMIAVDQCRENRDNYFEYKTRYEFQQKIVDSLRNQAAIDCEKKIEKALNRNHAHENSADRPVKPDFLK